MGNTKGHKKATCFTSSTSQWLATCDPLHCDCRTCFHTSLRASITLLQCPRRQQQSKYIYRPIRGRYKKYRPLRSLQIKGQAAELRKHNIAGQTFASIKHYGFCINSIFLFLCFSFAKDLSLSTLPFFARSSGLMALRSCLIKKKTTLLHTVHVVEKVYSSYRWWNVTTNNSHKGSISVLHYNSCWKKWFAFNLTFDLCSAENVPENKSATAVNLKLWPGIVHVYTCIFQNFFFIKWYRLTTFASIANM